MDVHMGSLSGVRESIHDSDERRMTPPSRAPSRTTATARPSASWSQGPDIRTQGPDIRTLGR